MQQRDSCEVSSSEIDLQSVSSPSEGSGSNTLSSTHGFQPSSGHVSWSTGGFQSGILHDNASPSFLDIDQTRRFLLSCLMVAYAPGQYGIGQESDTNMEAFPSSQMIGDGIIISPPMTQESTTSFLPNQNAYM